MDQFFPERAAAVAFSRSMQSDGDAGADGGWGTFVAVGLLDGARGGGHTLRREGVKITSASAHDVWILHYSHTFPSTHTFSYRQAGFHGLRRRR